jgi:aspartate 1-decarboxylase
MRNISDETPFSVSSTKPLGAGSLFACHLTRLHRGGFLPRMFRQVLKSKLHRAMITDADVEYEGSIEIPSDLMAGADLWAGEKVLVASITTGARLETYVLEGLPGTGKILINGGAAHLIKAGERVTIMAFGVSESPVEPAILLLDEQNQVLRTGR